MNEQWSLLWSQRQNALHIEPFEKTLSTNRQAYASNTGGDYRVLFVGERKDVDAAPDALRSTMADREFDRVRTAA
jgi:hypothetical protein